MIFAAPGVGAVGLFEVVAAGVDVSCASRSLISFLIESRLPRLLGECFRAENQKITLNKIENKRENRAKIERKITSSKDAKFVRTWE